MRSLSVGLLLGVAAIAGPASAQSAKPFYPPWGFDLTATDPKTRAGDDFFQHANGAYLARTVIPPDRVIASRRFEMTDRMEAQLKAILEEAARAASPQPTDLKGKVGAFYAGFMDEGLAERLAATPLAPEFNAIRSADRSMLARLMGSSVGNLYPSVFGLYIDTDLKKPDAYALYLGQGSLGLPDRDYYLKDSFAPQREAYRTYAESLLRLSGWPDAGAASARILAFETALANVSWTRVEQRDLTKQYNPVTLAELEALAPNFDWKAYLDGAGVGDRPRFVATTNTALPKLAAVIQATPVETLREWMAFRTADTAAPYLSKAFGEAYFQFREKTLQGQEAQRPRWKRAMAAVAGTDCVDATTCLGTMNWAVGQLYTDKHFPPATKAAMQELSANLMKAFEARIHKLEWMSGETKAEALKKLTTYQIKVGYPDKQRDYSAVAIGRDDVLGNVRRLATANWDFYADRSKGAVDKSDWIMSPQTNNAYNGSLRDIVFPAGILQAPIFDPNADPAINYGAIGGVIGHELTHGFDDQGRTIDASGALRDWWTAADAAEFKRRAAILGAQYAKFEPVPGSFINPDLTMGENIADLGGLAMALDAYHISLGGKTAPVLNGLTGDQRVFLGWAQAWAGKATPEEIRRYTTSDPHSFRKYRVNGVVPNIDEWYRAFGIKEGDALYIPKELRAHIW
ncbi:M13 family metallopeptidase [Sphingomonas sp. RB56-2]|uniref:M13 family metallopeptidase n=1 Tax=Sphingomonas brevis TaxID=2908206 RepID=A0ABT0S7U7_9SPHN|nr:M13 family metallopeptidase [Sphingomonas brevis]MCL6740443.1 M13 family metallopeptidase [Sphingomonas brevis]